MNQLTFLISQICFSAAKGSDWISIFRLEEDYENIHVPTNAINDPRTLERIICELDARQRNLLVEDIKEMIEEDNLY